MQDASKTLIDAISADWAGWVSLPKKELNFVQAPPTDSKMRFAGKQFSVECRKFSDSISKRSLGRSIHRETVHVDLWIDLIAISDDRKAELFVERQRMQDEVERIIKLRQRELTGIRFAFPRSWSFGDSFESAEPYLRCTLDVVCVYEK